VSPLPNGTINLCAGNTTSLDAGNLTQVPNTSLKWEWNTNPPSYGQTIIAVPNTTYQTFAVNLKDVRGCITLGTGSAVAADYLPEPSERLRRRFGDVQGYRCNQFRYVSESLGVQRRIELNHAAESVPEEIRRCGHLYVYV
jgi:hypothetical protein